MDPVQTSLYPGDRSIRSRAPNSQHRMPGRYLSRLQDEATDTGNAADVHSRVWHGHARRRGRLSKWSWRSLIEVEGKSTEGVTSYARARSIQEDCLIFSVIGLELDAVNSSSKVNYWMTGWVQWSGI